MQYLKRLKPRREVFQKLRSVGEPIAANLIGTFDDFAHCLGDIVEMTLGIGSAWDG